MTCKRPPCSVVEVLPEAQREAVELWAKGASFESIGQTLDVSARDAESVVRAAIEQMCRDAEDGSS